jgi:hypothetical protein
VRIGTSQMMIGRRICGNGGSALETGGRSGLS